MKIGYCRVSTDDQNPDLQLAALKRAGCKLIFTDKASGAHVKRPQLAKCLALLLAGDVLVVWKLDRLGRSLRDLIALLDDLKARDIAFRSLTEAIDTTTPTGRAMWKKGVYIRTDEFSQRFQALPATYDEIQHLANRRAASVERKERLIKRAEERFDVFVAMKNDPDQTGYTEAPNATLKLAINPLFPSRILIAQGNLLSLIQSKCVPWRGTSFPLSKTSLLSQHESVLILEADGQTYTLLEANIWGLLFYVCEIEMELPVDSHPTAKVKGIHLYALLGRLLVFLEHAHQIYGAMGYDGTLEVRVALERMRETPFIYSGFMDSMEQGPSSQLDDKISFVLDFPSSRLKTNRDAIAADLLRILFFAVNWPTMVDQGEQINALIKRGYQFNSW